MENTDSILIVDDDPAIEDVYVDLLGRDSRLELKTAGNGYDAGLFTEQFRPHLVILDYLLPDINGNHVCRRMRENAACANAKVLCVSGVINQPEIDALMQAGANAFLRKPFSIDELCKKIGELLEMEGVASPEQPA